MYQASSLGSLVLLAAVVIERVNEFGDVDLGMDFAEYGQVGWSTLSMLRLLIARC